MLLKNLSFLLIILSFPLVAQKIIKLPTDVVTDVTWKGSEKSEMSKNWNTPVITNVSIPTIEIHKPTLDINTGTAVIIAPGGGLYALSIKSEGTMVADWLVNKGITAIILKYRLVPTEHDGVAEYEHTAKNNKELLSQKVQLVLPYAIKDALNAIKYVRDNADSLNIAPDKIGMMGFSAGGAVTMGVAYRYTSENRPDFIVPIYPWTSQYPVQKPKNNEPPLFVVCASDDPLGLSMGSINLYRSWKELNLNAELHMYAKGGHGFGMNKHGLPSDNWIERFYEWGVSEKLITPKI
ncbi:alpha/beta hydrolase [Wenyingzhuangia sp. chi5]|uniref:Alpha/beta hydrolase n=1 Tax=Wenyingzhuangia gilva TaxID=3057677 RepID=A0ABT8VU69_9FLAO|nr:alpha/beta hydrolase [Wenyingzhuangia sp. chi5]MDO3695525.1 alpha/beta hydrolase [Wenyingzhuangia sp. chi5]